MKTRKSNFEKPLTGTGKVTIGEKTFTLNLTYKTGKDKSGDPITETEKFTFKKSELPDTLPDGWELSAGKDYFASVSADGSKLLNIRPAKGTFQVRCSSFSEKDEGDILLIVQEGQYGPYSQFVPLLTVQKGPHKGIQYPLYLPYGSDGKSRFVAGDDGNMEIVGNPDKSKGVAMLFDFLTYTGIIEREIEFPLDGDEPDDDPQSVLGTLLREIKKAKQDFLILVENGYPKSLTELEEEPTDTVSHDDDEAEKTGAEAVKEEVKKPKRKWDEE